MKGLARHALTVALTLALCLGAGELVCRACVPPPAPLRLSQDLAELERFGRREARTLFVPDEELFWRLAPDVVTPETAPVFRGRVSNAAGLREEHALASPKPPDELRVLFLGDSCTFGTGLALAEGYVAQVEQRLRRALSRPVECVNAGVPGWSAWQGQCAYERLAPRVEPDLVVFAFGWNDGSRWDGLSDEEHARLAARRRPPGPLARSRLCQLVWTRLVPAPRLDDAPLRPRVSPEQFAEILASLEQRTRAREQGLLVLVWPVRANFTGTPGAPLPRSAYQEVALRFARTLSRDDADVLDLCAPLRELATRQPLEALFQDHVHGTARTNAAVAEPIAAWIEARYRPAALAAEPPRPRADPAAPSER